MEIDGVEKNGQESAVGAYVAALKGKDAPKRGLRGKIKWSKKGNKNDDDDDDDQGDDMNVDNSTATALKSKFAQARGNQKFRGNARGEAETGPERGYRRWKARFWRRKAVPRVGSRAGEEAIQGSQIDGDHFILPSRFLDIRWLPRL